jgi:hypothetical protein
LEFQTTVELKIEEQGMGAELPPLPLGPKFFWQ